MISTFITFTPSIEKEDTFWQCYDQAKLVFDEVVIVNGNNSWSYDFSWPTIGEHFQMGYEQCNGDWVVHLDSDFFIHENNAIELREAFDQNKDSPALSLWKYQFIQPDRYNLKSRLVVAVNKKKFGDRIRFDSGGDLCQPSLDGKYIQPDSVPEARVPFYNYEKLCKSKSTVKEDVSRMDHAYHRHFNKWLYSTDGSSDSALDGWLKMVKGRFAKPQSSVELESHPKIIIETIKNLKPSMFGYDGWGLLNV